MKSAPASWLKWSAASACLILTCTLSGSTGIRLKQLSSEVLLERLRAAPDVNAKRHDELKKLFAESGCASADVKVPREDPNVICTLPGASESVIFVGAHFDKVSRGKGVVDNWSGAALLPSVYQSLNIVRRKHTIILVGFSGEEDGLIGSKDYVRHLSNDEKSKIHAMIAIDSIGLSATKVWASHSDSHLLNYLMNVSKSLNLPLSGMDVDYVGDTDSTPFRDAKIPTITLHSLTNDTFRVLHSERDTYAAIDQKAYVDTCHLITAYVAYLDEVLDQDAAPAPPTH